MLIGHKVKTFLNISINLLLKNSHFYEYLSFKVVI
jgi:hypothetical protein